MTELTVTFMSLAKLEKTVQEALENGWKPSYLRDRGCTCHISPPCSSCCLDDDFSVYVDEYANEHNIKLIVSQSTTRGVRVNRNPDVVIIDEISEIPLKTIVHTKTL